jgi:hypothetical protein
MYTYISYTSFPTYIYYHKSGRMSRGHLSPFTDNVDRNGPTGFVAFRNSRNQRTLLLRHLTVSASCVAVDVVGLRVAR